MANKSLKLGNNDSQMPAKKAKAEKKTNSWGKKSVKLEADADATSDESVIIESPPTEVEPTPALAIEPMDSTTEPTTEVVVTTEETPPEADTPNEVNPAEAGSQPLVEAMSDVPETDPTTVAIEKPREQTEVCDLKPKKLSLINATYQVLQTRNEPLTCSEIIDVLNTEGIWSSPKGKTPANTLYSLILREIKAKEAESRFQRIGSGKFIVRK